MFRKSYQLPPGVTAEDAPEINAKAFVFFTRTHTNTPDDKRRAVARLRDAQGVGAVTITIEPTPAGASSNCHEGDQDCSIEERNGIRIGINRSRFPDRPELLRTYVTAFHPDGTMVTVTADNMGVFDDGTWGNPGYSRTPSRPNLPLDREELIKIATIPGLTP